MSISNNILIIFSKMVFQRHFLLLTLVIVAVSADSAQETNPRFFGGIFGDLFGNNNQCSNCRHNLEEASYCCRNAIDSYCCQFSNNLINGGGFNPGYNPGGSDSYKPGSCPSNYYGKSKKKIQQTTPLLLYHSHKPVLLGKWTLLQV